MTIELSAEPVTSLLCELGEGPVWDDAGERLCWVDILAGRMHTASWDGEQLSVVGSDAYPAPLGAAAPRAGGGWVLATGTGFALVDADGTVQPLADAEPGRGSTMRMNDGKCDAAGRFVAGSMAYDATPGAGALFSLEPGGRVTPLITETTISNGLGWSGDGSTLYWVDTPSGQVESIAYDLATGRIGERSVFARGEVGESPDGLAVDAEDGVWVAFWGAGQVRRFDRSGTLTHVVEVPASQPSCPVLGGPDRRTLFVTSAFHGLSPDERSRQPHAGAVFAARVEVPGQPTAVFAG